MKAANDNLNFLKPVMGVAELRQALKYLGGRDLILVRK